METAHERRRRRRRRHPRPPRAAPAWRSPGRDRSGRQRRDHRHVVFDQSEPDHSLVSELPGRRGPGASATPAAPASPVPATPASSPGSGSLRGVLRRRRRVAADQARDAARADGRPTGANTAVTGITVEYADRTCRPDPERRGARLRPTGPAPGDGGAPVHGDGAGASRSDRSDWSTRRSPAATARTSTGCSGRPHAGPVAVVPQPLVQVRWGGSQFSRQWQTIVEAIDYGLAKHEVFHRDPRALGRLYGRRAFALAAMGRARGPSRGVEDDAHRPARNPGPISPPRSACGWSAPTVCCTWPTCADTGSDRMMSDTEGHIPQVGEVIVRISRCVH